MVRLRLDSLNSIYVCMYGVKGKGTQVILHEVGLQGANERHGYVQRHRDEGRMQQKEVEKVHKPVS